VAQTRGALAALSLAGGALAGWGLFESQWVETHEVPVPVAGLPPELAGLRILHLSDLHAGMPSLNLRAARKAVAYGVEQQPDMVVITGDLITHRRGLGAALAQLARLSPPLGMYVVLGNHDTGETRDPFSRAVVPDDWGDAPVQLLRDRSVTVEARGHRIEVAGMEPAAWTPGSARPHELFHDSTAFRILLAHFPDVIDDLPPGSCSLVLAGHLHGGQICMPRPSGRLRLSHTQWRYLDGVHRVGQTTLVVSRGIGTTLVPFRLLARPEAALLRLEADVTQVPGPPPAAA
jgi:predicted MPP superfamily phosphohydrolase